MNTRWTFQADVDGDGRGNECDLDADNDGVFLEFNSDQCSPVSSYITNTTTNTNTSLTETETQYKHNRNTNRDCPLRHRGSRKVPLWALSSLSLSSQTAQIHKSNLQLVSYQTFISNFDWLCVKIKAWFYLLYNKMNWSNLLHITTRPQ